MRKKLLKMCALALSTVMTLSFATTVFAAEDIVLDDGGSPFIKTFDPGEEGEYKYMGYVYCFEAPAEYKYLQITYTGDPTAFDQLRLEFVQNSAPEEEIKLPVKWFSENDEGSFVTKSGGLVPAPTSSEQTVVIDLEASGLDCSEGFRAFHVHDTPGMGTFTIVDARLITDADAVEEVTEAGNVASGKGSEAGSETKETESTVDNSGSGDGNQVTTVATAGSTTDNGSVAAPQTGSNTVPIAIALGGIVVAGITFVISGRMKEE